MSVAYGLSVGSMIMLLACAPGRAGDEGGPDDTEASADPVVRTTHYALHSDPWINLHHFLYQWARADRGIGVGRQSVEVVEREGDMPTGTRGDAWVEALDFYREHVAERGHFDLPMLELKAHLLELDGDPGITPNDEGFDGIGEVLAGAMGAYLDGWWPEHDRANRDWIDLVEADLRSYEDRWVETVSRAFGGSWVEGRLRVDVSVYGNWAGGYTSNGPAHTVILSTDRMNNRGLYGLELLFHESGHATPLGAPLRRATRDVLQSMEIEEPANLRHAMLFATAGEVVRRIAEERGGAEHVPYVVEEGLIGFDGWSGIWPAVRDGWIPALRRGDPPEEAIRAVAELLR